MSSPVAARIASSRLDHVDLAQAALGRGQVEPGEELRHRHPVAQVRRPRALDLRRRLDPPSAGRRVALPDHLRRAPGGDAGPTPRPARSPCPPPPAPFRASSAGRTLLAAPTRTSGPRCARRPSSTLAGSVKSLHPPVGAQDGECQRHRSAGDVRAAHVQEPGNGIGQRQHRRRQIPRHQRLGDLATLLGPVRAPPAPPGCAAIGRAGRGGWSAQAAIHQVLSPHQSHLPRPERLGQLLHLPARYAARGRTRAARPRGSASATQSAGLVLGMPANISRSVSTCPWTCSR